MLLICFFDRIGSSIEEIQAGLDYEVVPGTGVEPVRLAPRDFKSLVSTNFTIRACADPLLRPENDAVNSAQCSTHPQTTLLRQNRPLTIGVARKPADKGISWRREPESNRRRRLCRPLHNHSAIAPRLQAKKGGKHRFPPGNLERETSLELATSTLARLRSTN